MPAQYVLRPTRDTPENSLYHHGIKGMKWGDRNGPPYPLDSDQKSAAEKHHKRSSGVRDKKNASGGRDESDYANATVDHTAKKFHLTDEQKRLLKTGAKVVIAAAAAYGIYRLGDKLLDNAYSLGAEQLKERISTDKDTYYQAIDELQRAANLESMAEMTVDLTPGPIQKLAHAETFEAAIDSVNPYLGWETYNNNCVTCGLASILRTSFGLDVEGAEMNGASGLCIEPVIKDCFKNAKISEPFTTGEWFCKSSKNASDILREFCNGEDASGILGFQWLGGGGHCITWECKDGDIRFMDFQQHDLDVAYYFGTFLMDRSQLVQFARLDNAILDEEAIKKYVRWRKA